MISLDENLKPGQTVRVVRTVEYAFDVDISEFLAESDDSEVSVEDLQNDIESNFDISDILDQWDDVEVTDIAVTVTEIKR